MAKGLACISFFDEGVASSKETLICWKSQEAMHTILDLVQFNGKEYSGLAV